jgi:hypothetical protein
MGGSTLPVGMVWNYIGGIGIELDRCSQGMAQSEAARYSSSLSMALLAFSFSITKCRSSVIGVGRFAGRTVY